MQMLSTRLNLLQRTGRLGSGLLPTPQGTEGLLGTSGGATDEQILHYGLARKAKRLTVGCT